MRRTRSDRARTLLEPRLLALPRGHELAARRAAPLPGLAIVFALVLLAEPARALEERAPLHSLGGGLAVGLWQSRDDVLVPLRWIGPGAALTIGYRLNEQNWDLETRGLFGFGAMLDPYSNVGQEGRAELSARAHFEVATLRFGQLRLGPMASMREILFYPSPWDDDHLYYLGITGVGASAELLGNRIGSRRFIIEISMPILALVARPPRYTESKADDMVSVGFWLDRFASRVEPATLNHLVSVATRVVCRADARGFHFDPWSAIELDYFSRPADVTHLAIWLGIEARTNWGTP